jgi:hypothetical protein
LAGGENLFDAWKFENEGHWAMNRAEYGRTTEVVPLVGMQRLYARGRVGALTLEVFT